MSPTTSATVPRRLPVGAEPISGGGVHFRVWTPDWQEVSVVLEGGPGFEGQPLAVKLDPDENGYFCGEIRQAGPGTLYRFRLGDEEELHPDPASRFQPQGPFGPSQVVDANQFRWTDSAWLGTRLKGQVFYEVHVGTFTPEGTWAAAARQLPHLAETGITALEVMPVAEFPGNFGWGYDGVCPYAPYHVYGGPDDMRAFIDEAHRVGIGVLLDVVYHCQAIGSFLPKFSRSYCSNKYRNEWGKATNFDDKDAPEVRRYVLSNVRYWIEEFHLDGLRLDATQAYFDSSPRHILSEITRTAREAAGERSVLLVGESEPQAANMARPSEQGGFGIDSMWNDDFHHSAMVRLTGRTEAYYNDYRGTPEEFIASAKWGYLYQGQWYRWHKNTRGTPALDLPGPAFTNYLQNHDQLANSGRGQRIHELASPGNLRAMTALWLLMPGTPILFQGQEFAASSPFFYFADHEDLERRKGVAAGRLRFLSQFPSLALPELQRDIPDPGDPETFHRCQVNHGERERHREALDLHRDLLRLRREDPVFALQDSSRLHGSRLSEDAFLLRYLGGEHGDRLVLVNFGRDLDLDPMPQPLLAPPAGCQWTMLWSSEDPKYGGLGNPFQEFLEPWKVRGQCTTVLASRQI